MANIFNMVDIDFSKPLAGCGMVVEAQNRVAGHMSHPDKGLDRAHNTHSAVGTVWDGKHITNDVLSWYTGPILYTKEIRSTEWYIGEPIYRISHGPHNPFTDESYFRGIDFIIDTQYDRSDGICFCNACAGRCDFNGNNSYGVPNHDICFCDDCMPAVQTTRSPHTTKEFVSHVSNAEPDNDSGYDTEVEICFCYECNHVASEAMISEVCTEVHETPHQLGGNTPGGFSLLVDGVPSIVDQVVTQGNDYPLSSVQQFYIEAHTRVHDSGLPNFQGCRIPLPTGLHIDAWKDFDHKITDRQLIDFITFGFPVGYDRDRRPAGVITNHSGATEFPSDIDTYLCAELQDRHILGPFTHNPLTTPLMISPLNSVPKKDARSRRIISDLSYPKGTSVNDGIDKDVYLSETVDLSYPSVDALAEKLQRLGTTALMYKKDLKKAYRQLYIDPGDLHLLGYVWGDKVYIDLCLAMGIRSAAQLCQRVTTAVTEICEFEVINYLDDICGISNCTVAHEDYQFLSDLLLKLGLQESTEKAVSPTPCIEFLGVWFDARSQTMSVTKERLSEIHLLLDDWLVRKSASKKDLQSLIGKLQFISKVVLFSRIFISRLLLVLPRLARQYHRFRPDTEFRKDLRWWKTFLDTFNGVTLLPDSYWSDPDGIISTDACLTGGGGWIQGSYFHFRFPEEVIEADHHINILELLVVMVALKLWAGKVALRRVTLHCDNLASVHTLNSGRTRDPIMLHILREIAFICTQVNCHIRAVHLPGMENRLADRLSRLHLSPETHTSDILDPTWVRVIVDDSLFKLEHEW